ncbi:hypothetical protein BRC78_02955 [Halobacteriales archaeon QH_8_68_33]|nr:MAG: hypothetical protein BRC78_02955 [Halobacteriales archaeon QH_8_68_33]
MVLALLQALPGFGESAGQLVGVAASVILALMLVALAGFAYKSLRGDGIEWPDDKEEGSPEDGVSRGSDDDEWEFY